MTEIVGLAYSESQRSGPDHPAYESGALGELMDAAIRRGNPHVADGQPSLTGVVPQGGSVLLKPNWVTHANEGSGGKECLVTHPHFVLAALRAVLQARPARVVLGDAPIQGARIDGIVTKAFREQVTSLAREAGVPVEIVDFRRTTLAVAGLTARVESARRNESRYVLFDLGPDSLLEALSGEEPRFRVADYKPERLAESHRPGQHRYLLCREAFEADCILSMPKLKTHCKAGITGAVKNLVGLNGDKDFLPHHRLGGSEEGGDCYPGRSLAKQAAERVEDAANRRIGRPDYGMWRQVSRAARMLARGSGGRMTGAWYGNDTVWRMVLDLNRILRYGRPDGSMADTPQRALYSLTDAIVCGQGEGPLRPDPIDVGVVTFGSAPFACERIHAALLGLDPERIPLLARAGTAFRWPLPDANCRVTVRTAVGELDDEAVAERWGVAARPPLGWRDRIERRRPGKERIA